MNPARCITSAFVIALMIFCGTAPISLAQQGKSREGTALALDPQSEISLAAPWTLSAVEYRNAKEVVVMGPKQFPVARALITIEPRSSYADALERLTAIATSRDEPAEFIEIGGWPAVEVKFSELLPRRGGAKAEREDEAPFPDITVQRLITAVAADNKVVRFDVTVLPDAPQELLRDAQELTRSARFAKQGDPGEVQETLQRMRAEESKRHSLRQPRQGATPGEGSAVQAAVATQNLGRPVVVQTGLGELEIAASAGANNVVIASNGGLSFSANRAATFTAGSTGVFGLNDPSLARAATGNFYLGVIAFPTGTAAQLNVTGCTNAVSRSTDNGANFLLQGYSAQCPLTGAGVCFPDQEHIGADAKNAATGGSDQLYAVWRNFVPIGPVASCLAIGSGIPTASISCSQNNGATWTARAAIPGAGDFPRVAVGPAGDVFVVSLSGNAVLLNRFTSCANGLTAVAPMPVTVATLSGRVACPVPGLDRCNDGNTLSSPTVAPDPDDPNHVFVSFAENDFASGERIVVVESTDRGLTFPIRRIVSNTQSARRFMPWACATRGKAWIGWYDRSAATTFGATDDLTDYFVGSSDGLVSNITSNPDRQCMSGWPCGTRNMNDSEMCSIIEQPQLAGVCRAMGGGGSQSRCDFSDGGCPSGETCQTSSGCPKYGDYNGIACAAGSVFAAWSSATPPFGVTAPSTGINIYALAIDVSPQLTVFKVLEHPDHNHLRLFNLQIDGVTVRANVNAGSSGPKNVSPGNHKVGETGGTGTFLGVFSTVIGGDCAPDGTVNLAAGDRKTCTITNFDHAGGCSFGKFCCEPGDGTQGCQKCVASGQECP